MKENFNCIRDIFWIDEKINNKSNEKYKEIINEKFSEKLTLMTFDNFEKGFDEILRIRFKFIYLIISGKFFQTYVEKFDSNIDQLTTIPMTIIFTSKNYKEYLLGKKDDKTNKLNKKTLNVIRNPLYNFGFVVTHFKEILQFIENVEKNLDNLDENFKMLKILEEIINHL